LKNILFIIGLYFFLINNLLAMSEDYEKKLYWGCYPSSKQYLGSEKADLYCSCTVKTLSQKFSDQEMDSISAESGEKQLEAFNFASKLCGDRLNLN
jgi:hypothetical protein|tara:strand:- start:457 stop:744 length:288 start_codon:yes stop_codon:yes gene_type:complete